MELYNAASVLVDRAAITPTMSSSFDATMGASKCNDGVMITKTSTSETLCHTSATDSNPWLEMAYSCNIQLSSVKVYNRQACCGERILKFKLESYVKGNVFATYKFADAGATALNVYTVDMKGGAHAHV